MEAAIGLLLMLLGVSHGVVTDCDGRQDGAQCYGPLRGTVVLRLMDNASEIFRYVWTNHTRVILHGRKNRLIFNLIEDRSLFTPSDGTFRINNLNRNDDSDYTLTIFDSNGRTSERRTLQLTITDQTLLILAIRAAVMTLLLAGISIYFVCKKKKAEGPAVPAEMDYENAVVMVEMRHSASEL